MRILGVIPARIGSTRFPEKLLANLQGIPLIQWTIEGAKQSQLIAELIVATDDERIAAAAVACGVRVVMTEAHLPSGSDRIYAAIKNENCDVVVNIQGDEPLVTGDLIDRLAETFARDPHLDMATLAHPLSLEELQNPNAVKVVVNCRDEALYFSRYSIPYSRLNAEQVGPLDGAMKHIGMYAYTKKFLKNFCEATPALIEKAESLEQLRALYLGAKIKVIRVESASLGVDTAEDLARLEILLSQRK